MCLGDPGVGGMNQHTSDGSAFTRVTTAPSTAPAIVAVAAGMNQATPGATASNVSTLSGVVNNAFFGDFSSQPTVSLCLLCCGRHEKVDVTY